MNTSAALGTTESDTLAVGPLLPAVLLALGLLFPTSTGGNISNLLYAVHQLLFCALALWLVLRYGAVGTAPQAWLAGLIVVWCAAATALSPFHDLALGALGVYVTMAFLLLLDLSRLDVAWSTVVLRVASLLLILVAVGVLVASAPVTDWMTANYSVAYAELVPMMVLLRKPVFTFGSHSLAGFFYFLVFYLNFESWRVQRRPADLALALACIAAGIFLTSVTAAVLMSVALVLVFFGTGRARWPLFGTLLLAGGVAGWYYRHELADLVAVSNMLTSFESSASGLSGRFGRDGNLLGSLEAIRSLPLRPIGVSASSTVFFGDSGPVEYLLRGSWPLLLAVYGGLALFLWHNLRWRRHALVLFAVTVAFEVGMTVLTYHRFVYFLPFAVMHLNYLATDPRRTT